MDLHRRVDLSVFDFVTNLPAELRGARLKQFNPEPDLALIETVDAFMQRVVHVNITRCPHGTSGVMQVIEEIAPKRILMPLTTGPPS